MRHDYTYQHQQDLRNMAPTRDAMLSWFAMRLLRYGTVQRLTRRSRSSYASLQQLDTVVIRRFGEFYTALFLRLEKSSYTFGLAWHVSSVLLLSRLS